jgi:fumarate reductase subunit D
METFWKLFEKSMIVTAILTVLLVIIIGTLLIIGRPVPPELWTITFAVVGIWLGTKSTKLQTDALAAASSKPQGDAVG